MRSIQVNTKPNRPAREFICYNIYEYFGFYREKYWLRYSNTNFSGKASIS